MSIDIRKTLTIGAAALGLLALPSFAMAAGGDDMRHGGRLGHMGGRAEIGRSGGGFGEDHGVRAFRERVRERHLGREDRDRGVGDRRIRDREVREPVRERVHVARRLGREDHRRDVRAPAHERFHVGQRFGHGGGYGRRFAFGYGYPRPGYGPRFRHRVAYGFGYGRPRGRLVRICTVRFLPYRW